MSFGAMRIAISSSDFFKLPYGKPFMAIQALGPPSCKYGQKMSESASIPVENNASLMLDLSQARNSVC